MEAFKDIYIIGKEAVENDHTTAANLTKVVLARKHVRTQSQYISKMVETD